VGVAAVALAGRADEVLEEVVVRGGLAVYQEGEEGRFYYGSDIFT
jgi:hypothetical protein